jgi:hypothetical protein
MPSVKFITINGLFPGKNLGQTVKKSTNALEKIVKTSVIRRATSILILWRFANGLVGNLGSFDDMVLTLEATIYHVFLKHTSASHMQVQQLSH